MLVNSHIYCVFWEFNVTLSVLHMHLPLQRDCGRPPVPRRDPEDKPEEEPLLSNHPYVDKVPFFLLHISHYCFCSQLMMVD